MTAAHPPPVLSAMPRVAWMAGCALALTGLALGGCGGRGKTVDPGAEPQAAGWRQLATRADRERLSNWRSAFVQALDAAKAGGNGAAIAREGALLQPDAALEGASLPPGNYRCRVIKLGAKTAGMVDFIAYPAFSCEVAVTAKGTELRKISGSQRPVGLLYADDSRRQIFLGSMVLGDEKASHAYGSDADRDMVGAVERVGPERWRLVLPWPRFESTMDVVELVPAH